MPLPSTPLKLALFWSLLASTPTRRTATAPEVVVPAPPVPPVAPPPPKEVVLPAMPWGWGMFVSPGSGHRNLCLTWDIGPHCLDYSCACGAELDDDGWLVHKSFDGRERYEQGLAQRH